MEDATIYPNDVCEVCGSPLTVFKLPDLTDDDAVYVKVVGEEKEEYLVCSVAPEHGPDIPPVRDYTVPDYLLYANPFTEEELSDD
jgi:hypothetical protein